MKQLKYIIVLTLLVFLSLFNDKVQPVTIFMIGDSTMADKSLKNGNLERGWGQMLTDVLSGEIKVENYAKDGRSTKSFIAEGRWETVMARLKKGDYVFIQFGHNDEKTDSALHTVVGGSFDENLRRFVRETRAKGAFPVLFNSIVRRNFPPEGMKEHRYVYEKEGDILVDTHGEYREVPRKVAMEMNVPFVDANRLTHDLVVGLGVEESKKLFMWVPAGKYAFCPKGKVDNTHLNINGARTVASLLMKATVEVVPKLKSYFRQYDSEVYVAPYKGNRQCAISYTFDDGLLEHYTLVYPKLEEYGFKGTFWVCGKIIEDKKAALGKPRMTWKQMKEMSEKGHEISNHGWSHLILPGKTEIQIREEIDRNDSIILAEIGKRPVTFCYPGNYMDEQSVAIASIGRAGTRQYQYAIGGEKSQSTPEELDKWLDELLTSGGWGVSMTHGITYGYDFFADSSVLWNHLEKVKSKKDSVWVATFEEVSAYVKEWKNIRLEICKGKTEWVVTPCLPLDSTLFNQPLTIVLNLKSENRIRNVWQDGKQIPVQKRDGKCLFEFNPYGGIIRIRLK